MPIRIFYPEPGPEAEAALKRHWSLAHDIAADILRRLNGAPIPEVKVEQVAFTVERERVAVAEPDGAP